jgi:hypothetical protein
MALLEEAMVTMRLQFNERYLALRQLKKDIIFAVRRDNQRIRYYSTFVFLVGWLVLICEPLSLCSCREIDVELGQPDQSSSLWEPTLDPSEYPDDRGFVTSAELEKYIKDREAVAGAPHVSWLKTKAPPNSIVRGVSTLLEKQTAMGMGSAMVIDPYNTAMRDPQLLLFGGDDAESERLRKIASSVVVQPTDVFLVDDSEMKKVPARDDAVKEFEVRDSALARFRPLKTDAAGQARLQAIEQSVPVLMFAANAMKHKMMVASSRAAAARAQSPHGMSRPVSRPVSTVPQSEEVHAAVHVVPMPPLHIAGAHGHGAHGAHGHHGHAHSSPAHHNAAAAAPAVDPSTAAPGAVPAPPNSNQTNRLANIQAAVCVEMARAERTQRLEFERRSLLSGIDHNVAEFDAAIEELRVDRHAALADLKLTELKLIVLYQEYQLLQTFESRDMSLQQKQLRCLNDKNEVVAAATDAKAKLDLKMDELGTWNEKNTQILAEVKSLLPESNPHGEILNKIFKKKIKRKKAGADGEDEEEEVSTLFL